MIGERLRQARQARNLSLQDVATEAEISVATLSRIETSKQSLEMNLFISIAKILGENPADFFDIEEPGSKDSDSIVEAIGRLTSKDRTRVWDRLAKAPRIKDKGRDRRSQSRVLGQEIEEVLAQLDYLRNEVDGMRKRTR